MANTNRPYDLKHHYYMYDIGWLIDKIQAVSDELGQAIDLRTIHYADPINWDITTQYQANTVVVDNKTGVAYISSKNVPAGVLLTNTEYWNPIFNYNDAINKLMSTIAYNEQDSPTATAAHAKGSYIYSNAVLYQAMKDIADGDALKVGANMQLVTLSDAINTAIEAAIAAAREAVNDEAADRAAADAALSERIDAEAAARADADANYTGTNKVSTVTGDDTRTAGDITDTADNVVIHGKKSILMDSDGTYTEDITGKKKVNADNVEETYRSTRSIHVVGEQTEAIDSNATKSIGGTYSKTVTGVTTEIYNAARSITGTNSTESYTGKKVISAQDIQLTPASGALTYSKPVQKDNLVIIPFKSSDGINYNVLCEGTKISTDSGDPINAIAAGFDPTGVNYNDDVFAANSDHSIFFPEGTYRFKNGIEIKNSIYGTGATEGQENGDTLTRLVFENGAYAIKFADTNKSKIISGVNITPAEGGILYANSVYSVCRITHVLIGGCRTYGIKIAPSIMSSRCISIDNVQIFGDAAYTKDCTAYVFNSNAPDCTMHHIYSGQTQIGIDSAANILTLSDVHLWTGVAGAAPTTAWYRETKGFKLANSTIIGSNIYIDSAFIPIFATAESIVNMTSLVIWYDDTIPHSEHDGSLMYGPLKVNVASGYIYPSDILTNITVYDGLTMDNCYIISDAEYNFNTVPNMSVENAISYDISQNVSGFVEIARIHIPEWGCCTLDLRDNYGNILTVKIVKNASETVTASGDNIPLFYKVVNDTYIIYHNITSAQYCRYTISVNSSFKAFAVNYNHWLTTQRTEHARDILSSSAGLTAINYV